MKNGSRYATNIVIFTKDFSVELDNKTSPAQKEIGECIGRFLDENEQRIRAVGFTKNDMSRNLYRWLITANILAEAAFVKFQGSLDIAFPKTAFGDEAFVWGEEIYPLQNEGILTNVFSNKAGDWIRFLDIFVNGSPRLSYFANHKHRVNILLDIAGGNTDHFSENDSEEIAGFIRNGFIEKGDRLVSGIPVFNGEQFANLLEIIDPLTSLVSEKITEMANTASEIIVQHAPGYLKETAQNMGWLKMFNIAITAPVKTMVSSGCLIPAGANEIPTAYIVLAR